MHRCLINALYFLLSFISPFRSFYLGFYLRLSSMSLSRKRCILLQELEKWVPCAWAKPRAKLVHSPLPFSTLRKGWGSSPMSMNCWLRQSKQTQSGEAFSNLCSSHLLSWKIPSGYVDGNAKKQLQGSRQNNYNDLKQLPANWVISIKLLISVC